MPVKPYPGLPVSQQGPVRLPTVPNFMRPEAMPKAPPPPPPQQPTTLGVASDYEAATRVLAWPREVEVSVYTTTRRWRACDVYVTLPEGLSAGPVFQLSIFVYALAQGARTLVASGRVDYSGSFAATSARLRHWIAAARAVAERYEVTARVSQSSSSAALVGNLTVTVAAADEMTDPPPGLGAFPRFSLGTGGVKFQAVGISAPPALEVLSARGVNTAPAPAPRYMQLYDASITAFAQLAAQQPRLVWPMGTQKGEGVVVEGIHYRAQVAPVLVVSSSPGAYVDPGDSDVGMTVR